MAQPLLTRPELAERLNISLNTLDKLRMRGALPPAVKVGGSVRWRPEAVEHWIAEQAEPATPRLAG